MGQTSSTFGEILLRLCSPAIWPNSTANHDPYSLLHSNLVPAEQPATSDEPAIANRARETRYRDIRAQISWLRDWEEGMADYLQQIDTRLQSVHTERARVSRQQDLPRAEQNHHQEEHIRALEEELAGTLSNKQRKCE